MSRVCIMVIDKRGRIETRDEARNASAFHPAIWDHLLLKYKLARPHQHFPRMAEGGQDLKVLGRIWQRVGKIDRADGLVLAATFDRVWFPRECIHDLRDALRVVQGELPSTYVQTLADIAGRLDTLELSRTDRGVCFQGSIVSTWWCGRRDDNHRIGMRGHSCTTCHKKVQHALHMLDERECCAEPKDPIYVDDTRD